MGVGGGTETVAPSPPAAAPELAPCPGDMEPRLPWGMRFSQSTGPEAEYIAVITWQESTVPCRYPAQTMAGVIRLL